MTAAEQLAADSRARQGLPRRLDDEVVLAAIAALVLAPAPDGGGAQPDGPAGVADG